MRIGTVTVDPHQQNATMKEFKARIEPKLGSSLRVELYPASQLGTIPQMLQGLLNGSVQAVILPAGFFGPLAPAINVVDLPYFFKDSEQAFRLLNGDAGRALADYLKTKGMIPLAWLWGGDRYILTKFPVHRLEDLKGKKIRTFPTPVAQGEVNAWGDAATIIDTSEVPVALQQGTIDGVASDMTFFHSMRLYLTARYLLLAPRGAIVNPFMVSRVWFEGLPAPMQEAIASVARDVVVNYATEYVRDYLDRARDEMVQAGLQIIEPSPEMVRQMQAASMGVHEAYKKSSPEAAAIYEALQKAIAGE